MQLSGILLLSLFSSFSFNKADNSTLYFHPSCSSSTKHEECHTLNDWIKSGHNPFTNDTTVKLLAGVHFINFTKDSLDVRNVHSLRITGEKEQREQRASLYCGNGLKLNFNVSNGISISQITLNSCTLIFSYMQNITIDDVMIIDGDLQYYSDCMHRITDKIKSVIKISKSILHNSSTNNACHGLPSSAGY